MAEKVISAQELHYFYDLFYFFHNLSHSLTSCFLGKPEVSFAAVIRVVTQRSGEALCDDPNNGCEGD